MGMDTFIYYQQKSLHITSVLSLQVRQRSRLASVQQHNLRYSQYSLLSDIDQDVLIIWYNDTSNVS